MGCMASHGSGKSNHKLYVGTQNGARAIPPLGLNILIIGDQGVGKSNLVKRYTEAPFLMRARVHLQHEIVETREQLQSGGLCFRRVPDTVGPATVILYVYSINSRGSFLNVDLWKEEVEKRLEQLGGTEIVQFVVGNCVNSEKARQVETEEAKRYAEENNMNFFETCEKDDVDETFSAVVAAFVGKQHKPINFGTEYEYLFKLVLLGNSGVGKSSLMMRFIQNTYFSNICPSISIDFMTRLINIEGCIVKLQIWDTAGQEKFRSITSAYYRGAHGFLVIYDVTSPESLESIPSIITEVRNYNENALITLVGNKTDLVEEKKVSLEDAKDVAALFEASVIEVSAKEAQGVTEAFTSLAVGIKRILDA